MVNNVITLIDSFMILKKVEKLKSWYYKIC